MEISDFEKLGVFYLGRPVDAESGKVGEAPLLYESKNLVTHALCVGMTGSGKTGLCIGLLEEAAIDGIPAIIVDPKGDLANLLLTFPSLTAEQFRPWINEDDARARGLSADEFASAQADLWAKGLAASSQDGARIQRLKDSVKFTIFTPGSDAGVPISILKSFDAPPPGMAPDREMLRDRVSSTATSLLGLLGIDGDPLSSREHVLLSNIFDSAWRENRNLDLAAIIGQVQTPPFSRVGVMDLDAFYPPQERFELAIRLNNLLGSPGFESWLEGVPLDIAGLLHTPEGKPQVAILSIAHLSESERMFFVSLLLNQLLGWVRTQPGTTSLRAVFYMDEIFGYVPPIANPPSKRPLLTLLKQSRAYGLGIVLATQNPVDLDYKGLSNTGTWFIGRLQTERDKLRVLEGLEGAAGEARAPFDRQRMERTLAGLTSRVFLLNSAQDNRQLLFETRWTLSYLRGPLTGNQIRTLMVDKPSVLPSPALARVSDDSSPTGKYSESTPILPPGIPQYFAPIRSFRSVTYQPLLVGAARLYFVDPKHKLDETRDILVATAINEGANAVDWARSIALPCLIDEMERQPEKGARFAPLPRAAGRPRSYATWSKSFERWVFHSQKLEFLVSPTLGERSLPGESERDFRVRLQQLSREKRDRAADALRRNYSSRLAVLEDRRRRAERAERLRRLQRNQVILESATSVGADLLTAFLGRRPTYRPTLREVASAVQKVGRSLKETEEVDQAVGQVEQLTQKAAALEQEFEAELAAQKRATDPATEALDTVSVRLKRANLLVQTVALCWVEVTV